MYSVYHVGHRHGSPCYQNNMFTRLLLL